MPASGAAAAPGRARSGLGVWASLAVPVADRERLQALPMRVAVALADVVARVGGAACRLKWPNDLVIGRRKLGGILIDAVSRHDGATSGR